jgi:DNA-binding MarR family transcriptional regulator
VTRKPRAKALPKSAVNPATTQVGLGYLVRRAHRSFVWHLGDRLSRHDITPAQWSALRALWKADGCSQVELAARIEVEKASLTSVLDALERRQLAERRRSADDRRKWNVYLTKAGRELQSVLLPYAAEVNKLASKDLSQGEAKALRRILLKIIKNMRKSAR